MEKKMKKTGLLNVFFGNKMYLMTNLYKERCCGCEFKGLLWEEVFISYIVYVMQWVYKSCVQMSRDDTVMSGQGLERWHMTYWWTLLYVCYELKSTHCCSFQHCGPVDRRGSVDKNSHIYPKNTLQRQWAHSSCFPPPTSKTYRPTLN